ncbi:M23 family metallopeptidase [Arthrobacter psychrochitiniphilus]|uniref:Peptidase M23 n=1 Tax=Arthrobacter psychrochitiniphilus TaxID=291045 RepID=A0A2V3DX75_9MICC|nr:M23 family metallopeptidase [Arthrobacter psychrochitiniphilus]NYG16775.1 murein DD-endopeptidase MepM/ murein hydrolase activator NlpD [Arthrobacter psychrochitiniphilus]PXA69130.1 peptidase M23 [Arthrobacter psychrochitiniphilus]
MNLFSRRISLLLAVLLSIALLPGPAPGALAASTLASSEARASAGAQLGNGPPRTTSATPLPVSLAWGWPLAGKPEVIHIFDPPSHPWLSGHRGVDLAAEQGAEVLAPTEGVVSFSGVVVTRGVLTLATEDGLRLSFEPVTSPLKVGDAVARGQQLGTMEGPTHCESSPAHSCLHWGVRRGDDYLNPLQFILDLRPSVLLPLAP